LILKQKAAIRIITKSSYNAHTQPLFKRLEILPLESLIKYHKLVFFQSVVQKKAPLIFDNVWMTNRMQRLNLPNRRELRDDNEYFVKFARTKTLERSPLFTLPNDWNTLPPDLQIIRNVAEFKSKLKKFYLNQIPDIFHCNRLFCPACHNALHQ